TAPGTPRNCGGAIAPHDFNRANEDEFRQRGDAVRQLFVGTSQRIRLDQRLSPARKIKTLCARMRVTVTSLIDAPSTNSLGPSGSSTKPAESDEKPIARRGVTMAAMLASASIFRGYSPGPSPRLIQMPDRGEKPTRRVASSTIAMWSTTWIPSGSTGFSRIL